MPEPKEILAISVTPDFVRAVKEAVERLADNPNVSDVSKREVLKFLRVALANYSEGVDMEARLAMADHSTEPKKGEAADETQAIITRSLGRTILFTAQLFPPSN